jgi:fatty acid-binding protein DegV
MVGSLLQVKPILTLQDGVVVPYEKQRTHKRAVLRLVEIVQAQYPISGDGCPVVMHADAPQEAAQLAENLASCLQLPEIQVIDLPPAIVVHGGPGSLAVSFIKG